METLSDLIRVVNKKRISKIDVLDKTFLNSKSENLYYKLYNAIESGKISTDEEAAQLVYGTNKTDPRYKMLKSRLKDKVLKSVMLLDVDDAFNNEVGKAYYECLTHLQIIEIIIKFTGTTILVVKLIKENYSKSVKYKFYDILSKYSYYLIIYYSFKGDKRSLNLEEKKFIKYVDLEQKEKIAKCLYSKAVVGFESGDPITNDLISDTKENLDKLYVFSVEIKTPDVDFHYIYLAFMFYEISNDFEKLLEICNSAEVLLKNNSSYITYTRKFAILYYKSVAFLYLKKYKEGLRLIDNTTIDIPETNYNWFVLNEVKFKLYLQFQRISETYGIYKIVVSNKSFNRQVVQITEKWKIYYAYLVFMDNYLNNGDYKFNLPKFLNDVPINSKDKSGFNFAIRIIEILFLFAHKKYNVVFAKMEALRIYRSRYLNDNTYKRNHLFLSLLLKAEKTGFDSSLMQKADWKEIKLLNERNNIIADWEIIPYETLWDIFVELAKK